MKLSQIFTAPNQLTLLRMVFVPFIVIELVEGRYFWALILFVIAGFSDGLDGLLARGLNQKTPLGAYLDPIADKLLMFSSYFVLALKGKIAWWLTILVLGRDVILLTASAAILVTVGYRPFPPSIWGKVTTTLEILLVLLVILLKVFPSGWLTIMQKSCVYLVAFFVVFTGFHYSIIVSRRLNTGG